MLVYSSLLSEEWHQVWRPGKLPCTITLIEKLRKVSLKSLPTQKEVLQTHKCWVSIGQHQQTTQKLSTWFSHFTKGHLTRHVSQLQCMSSHCSLGFQEPFLASALTKPHAVRNTSYYTLNCMNLYSQHHSHIPEPTGYSFIIDGAWHIQTNDVPRNHWS